MTNQLFASLGIAKHTPGYTKVYASRKEDPMRLLTTALATATLLILGAFAVGRSAEPSPDQETADMQPVEESINVHMSSLFKPSYRRLKPLMVSEPTDAAGWNKMRSEALLLAECGSNLTQYHSSNGFNPDAKKNWPRNSADVKKHAAALYNAAKKQDFDNAKRSYTSMTNSCNACHKSEVSLGSPPMLTPFGKGITDN